MSSPESETSESLSRLSSLSSEYCSDVLADSSLEILPYQFEPLVPNASEQMDLSDEECLMKQKKSKMSDSRVWSGMCCCLMSYLTSFYFCVNDCMYGVCAADCY